jgi:hypothetical protein
LTKEGREDILLQWMVFWKSGWRRRKYNEKIRVMTERAYQHTTRSTGKHGAGKSDGKISADA